MKRFLLTLFAALAVSTHVNAQTATTPEEITLAAHQVCYDVERGVALSSLAAAQGFRASTQEAGAFVRTIPGFVFQLLIIDKVGPDGRTSRFCTLGVRGRFADFSRVQSFLVARSRSAGFTIEAPTPRPAGFRQKLHKRTPGRTQELIIATNDNAIGANYSIMYAWLL